MADQADKLRDEMRRMNEQIGESVMRIFQPLPTMPPRLVCCRCEIATATHDGMCAKCSGEYDRVSDAAQHWLIDDPSNAPLDSIFRTILAAIREDRQIALLWLRDTIRECDPIEAAAQCLHDLNECGGYESPYSERDRKMADADIMGKAARGG